MVRNTLLENKELTLRSERLLATIEAKCLRLKLESTENKNRDLTKKFESYNQELTQLEKKHQNALQLVHRENSRLQKQINDLEKSYQTELSRRRKIQRSFPWKVIVFLRAFFPH